MVYTTLIVPQIDSLDIGNQRFGRHLSSQCLFAFTACRGCQGGLSVEIVGEVDGELPVTVAPVIARHICHELLIHGTV